MGCMMLGNFYFPIRIQISIISPSSWQVQIRLQVYKLGLQEKLSSYAYQKKTQKTLIKTLSYLSRFLFTGYISWDRIVKI